MFDLFGDQVATPMPALELEEATVPREQELAWEKELLGVYVSEHPYKAAAAELSSLVTMLCAELAAEETSLQASINAGDGDDVADAAPAPSLPPQGRDAVIAGVVGNTRRLYTRDGRPFCAAEIEDLSGMIEVTVWPEQFERTQDFWIEGNIVVLQVRARERNDRLQIAVNEVELFRSADGAPTGFVPPDWLLKDPRPNGGKKPNGRRANGKPANGAATKPAAAQRSEPVAVAAEPVETGKGSTSDQRLPSSEAKGPATSHPATAQAVATAQQALRVELWETDDEDADRDRLQRLLEALRDAPGEDEVRLTLHTLDGAAHRMPAKLRVRATDDLASRLERILSDVGTVEVLGAN
jgi:DNA polymerase-3 subunit alpha